MTLRAKVGAMLKCRRDVRGNHCNRSKDPHGLVVRAAPSHPGWTEEGEKGFPSILGCSPEVTRTRVPVPPVGTWSRRLRHSLGEKVFQPEHVGPCPWAGGRRSVVCPSVAFSHRNNFRSQHPEFCESAPTTGSWHLNPDATLNCCVTRSKTK